MCSHRIPSSDTSDKPPAVPTAFPGRSAARSGALLSRGPSRSVEIGPGSAEQREGRCTASGTRVEFALRGRVVICPSGGFLTGLSSLISDFPKNISVPTHPKSDLELFASHPTRGAYRDRHGRGVRMRWTRQRLACDGMAGRVMSL
jgi:hypothetical protein